MGKLIDLTGQRFGKWTVIERAPSKTYIRKGRNYQIVRWLCICDCGNSRIVDAVNLIHRRSRSCGCLQKEIAADFCREIGKTKGNEKAVYKHGDTIRGNDRLYYVWASMKQRCCNKNSAAYKDYGGRGITVCEEWKDYINFRDWAMSNGYDPYAEFAQCTIDRIDVDGNYCPENCRWVSAAVQAQNKRNSKKHS